MDITMGQILLYIYLLSLTMVVLSKPSIDLVKRDVDDDEDDVFDLDDFDEVFEDDEDDDGGDFDDDSIDDSDGNSDGIGWGALMNLIGEMAEKVEAGMDNAIDDLIGGQDPDDLPDNYDNSTSQTTKINETASMQTNTSVHRENQDGVEETVIQKTQLLKDKDNKVIGQGSEVVVDIISDDDNNNSKENTGQGQGQLEQRNNGKSHKEAFKRV